MLERISRLIKSKKLSSSQFADSIGVQRSSVSHVLSGRNKPSLDFVTKILSAYDDINPDWLLNGTGPMLRDEADALPAALPFDDSEPEDGMDGHIPFRTKPDPPVDQPALKKEAGKSRKAAGKKSIDKIVLFYADGTFREFSPDEF